MRLQSASLLPKLGSLGSLLATKQSTLQNRYKHRVHQAALTPHRNTTLQNLLANARSSSLLADLPLRKRCFRQSLAALMYRISRSITAAPRR